jgi:hypothetical protein
MASQAHKLNKHKLDKMNGTSIRPPQSLLLRTNYGPSKDSSTEG